LRATTPRIRRNPLSQVISIRCAWDIVIAWARSPGAELMSEMKSIAMLAMIGLAAMAGAASAADMAVPYGKAETFVVPAYSWSGGYVGLNVGYGFGRSSDTAALGVPSLFVDTANLTANGFNGGGQIGFNVQMQNWVWGFETDLQGTNQTSSHTFNCPAGLCSASAIAVTTNQHLDLFGTVRGRAGVAVIPEVLLYATGGLAYGQVHTDSNLTQATRQQSFVPGWTVGAGIEGAVGGGWSVRLEYLHIDLGKVNGVFTANVLVAGGAAIPVQGFDTHVTNDVVRVGFNYSFFGPTIAKY
jgi:outer membrane immunogenic protein